MNKTNFLIAAALLLSMTTLTPKAPAKKAAPNSQPTEVEQEAYGRLLEKMIQRYEELGVHELITEALQEVADENPEEMKMLLKFGVEDPNFPGKKVIPVGPLYFFVQ